MFNLFHSFFLAGKQPGDRERVNPQVVSNWFANKRKEMKKVAREGLLYSPIE